MNAMEQQIRNFAHPAAPSPTGPYSNYKTIKCKFFEKGMPSYSRTFLRRNLQIRRVLHLCPRGRGHAPTA